MTIAILLFGVLILLLVFLFLQIVPTVINIFLSRALTKKFIKFNQKPFVFSVFFLITSFLLGVNSRIPEVTSDVANSVNTLSQVNYETPVYINKDDNIILVTDVDSIYYKKNPLATVITKTFGGGFSPNLGAPRIDSEYIIGTLKKHGIAVSADNLSSIKLQIKSKLNGYLDEYYFSLYDGNTLISEGNVRVRVRYKGDIPTDIEELKEGKFWEFMIHNNYWNWILHMFNLNQVKSPFLSEFLENSLRVKSN